MKNNNNDNISRRLQGEKKLYFRRYKLSDTSLSESSSPKLLGIDVLQYKGSDKTYFE